MKKMKKLFAVGIMTFAVSSTVVVYAAQKDVDGGTWKYGYGWGRAYSEYYHSYNNHGAKVVNANNGVKDYKNSGAGVWAKAGIGTLWDPATFYYNPTGHYTD